MYKNYLDKIFKNSDDYLKKIFTDNEYDSLKNKLKNKNYKSDAEYVELFLNEYTQQIKKNTNQNINIIKNFQNF